MIKEENVLNATAGLYFFFNVHRVGAFNKIKIYTINGYSSDLRKIRN